MDKVLENADAVGTHKIGDCTNMVMFYSPDRKELLHFVGCWATPSVKELEALDVEVGIELGVPFVSELFTRAG